MCFCTRATIERKNITTTTTITNNDTEFDVNEKEKKSDAQPIRYIVYALIQIYDRHLQNNNRIASKVLRVKHALYKYMHTNSQTNNVEKKTQRIVLRTFLCSSVFDLEPYSF